MQERNPNLDMDVDPPPVQQLKRKASSGACLSLSRAPALFLWPLSRRVPPSLEHLLTFAPPPPQFPPSTDLIKSSTEDRKENPAALSQQSSAPDRPSSPGAEESDLTDDDEDEMLIMPQEKPATSMAASASGSTTTTTAPVKKPRQTKPKVLVRDLTRLVGARHP